MFKEGEVARESAEAISEGINRLAEIALGETSPSPNDVETLSAMRAGLLEIKSGARVFSTMVVEPSMLDGLDELLAKIEGPDEAIQTLARTYLANAWPATLDALPSLREAIGKGPSKS